MKGVVGGVVVRRRGGFGVLRVEYVLLDGGGEMMDGGVWEEL